MSEHTGGCQCGAVRYRVEMEVGTPVVCNCSRCRRLASRLQFVPESAFTLESGEEALTEYLFASHTIRHVFCSTCGIQSFAWGKGRDGSTMVAINVNCLDGVDAEGLDVQHFDGASS